MLLKYPIRAKSVGRGGAGKNLFLILFFIFLLGFIPLVSAMAAPDTVIVAGPTGSLSSNDLAFWWTGKTTSPDTYISGFYYRLDSEPWNWTRERVIAYYDLSNGSHRLDVKAVDSANSEDPSPASRSFSVNQSSAVEPDESPFSVDMEFLEFEIDLDRGSILAGLRRKFKDESGIVLSQSARVFAKETGSRWLINDGNKAYTLRREGGDLSVYEGDALFSISSGFANELDDGAISEDLKEEFDDEDITLAGDANVSAQESGSWWKITDGGTYTIRKEGNRLNVYKGDRTPTPAGRLFNVDRVEYTTVNLDNGDVPGSLRQEFGSNGIALSQNAAAVPEDGGWLITDADKVYIVKEEGNDELSIYQSVNDESSAATIITPGVAIEALSQPDSDDNDVDHDWFRVTVEGQPAPRQLAVFFHRPDAIGSTTVEIYRHPKLNQKLADFEAEDRAFFATGVTAGDYLIHIIPSGESPTAPYFLTATIDSLTSEIIWDAEINDSSANATETPSISMSRSNRWVEMVGNKRSASDSKDWFRIYINADQPTRLSLNLTRPRSGETKVTLHPSAPSSIVGEFTVTSSSNPQWKLQTGVETGEYLLEVDVSEHDDSTYFLTLQTSDFSSDEVWEQEPNDSFNFANQLPFGVRIRATKGHASDTSDWFRFFVPNDGIFNLTTSRILGTGAVNIFLLDPILLSPVGDSLDYGIQTDQQRDWLNLDILAGEYFVQVDLANLAGDYWFTAMFITSLQHDAPADDVLVVGDVLSVEMIWDPGNAAAFDVSTADGNLNDAPIPMYDDGLHGDGGPNDGLYVGTYTIQGIGDAEDDDHITDAMVTAHLQDSNGNTANISVGEEFTIDTTPPDDLPPEISNVEHDATRALRTRQKLTVTIYGEAGNAAAFDIGEYRLGLPAYDDGKHDDGIANDGVYVGEYTVLAEDFVFDAAVTGHLVDDFGNAASLEALTLVDIVGDRPVIDSVDHNARLTLGKGDTLEVTMIGDPDGIASFDISDLASNIPMYDDGQHNDGDRGDGRYVGTYEVTEGDGVFAATVTARLLDRKGRETAKASQLEINIDAVAPAPVMGVNIQDRPDDQGGFLSLIWNASTELDFSHYNIYLSQDVPVSVSAGRVVGLSPVKSDITDPIRTSVDLEIESDLTDHFAAVTAVDIMGNESLLDTDSNSIAGPAQAIDNLKPTPARRVEAVDRDQDFGGVIILSWTDVNQDEDFARYNIYQETNPILSTEALRPVDSIMDRYVTVLDIFVSDGIDHYFAVTAVDSSNNESELDEFSGSVAGPVRAENNIGVEPDAPVKILSGPVGEIHHSHVAFHWSRFGSDPHTGYYFRLDDASWQWTTDSTIAYHDLGAGQHTFSVRVGESIVSRSFTVVPVFTSEREPNDSRDMAYGIRAGMIIRGDNAHGDDDWFRIHVPPIESSVMDILLSRPKSVGSTEIVIYADQPFREVGNFSSDAGQPVHFALGVAPGSDYFVRVSSNSDDSQYRLVATINRLPIGFAWEVEDNDTGILANPLNVPINESQSVEVRGSSGGDQDLDWFKLHIPDAASQHPVWMNVSFYRSNISTVSVVEIYSLYPDTIDRQIGKLSIEPLSNMDSFSGIVERGGDYFIKVDNGDEPMSSDYQLLLSLVELPADEGTSWEVEPNGLVAWANPLQLGVKQRGNSWDGNEDDDWYVLDTRPWMLDSEKESSVLNLHFSRPSGIGTTSIELYDTIPITSHQSPVAQIQINTASAQKGSINVDAEAGIYYIKIHPQNETSSAEYELVALLVESTVLTRFAADGGEIERVGRPLKIGDVIQLSLMWSIGAAQATFDIGDVATDVPMIDQGDGLYIGAYTVKAGDDEVAAPVTAHLLDQFGKTTDIELGETVTVDTISPGIFDIFHDGITPLSAGKKLTVTMIGEPRGGAKFHIVGFKTGLDMYSMTSDEADPPLIILNWDWRPDPPFGIIVAGEIKNISDSTRDRVKINATFFDADDNIVGEDSAFTAPRNIPPGVSAPFSIHADHIEQAENVKIQLLYDFDGKIVGESADDGVYMGFYEVGDDDNISNAAIICYLTDSAGNQSSIEAASAVTFDTIPPIITELTHDAGRALVDGDILTVTLTGESDGEANFSIGDFRTDLDMSEAETGRYVGAYRVRAGDEAIGALITGYLKDSAGNEVTYIGVRTVSINTAVPNISAVTHNGAARPFIEGETLIVTVNTDPGVVATFHVEGLINNRPMHDDGQHDDGDPGDGIYKGSYIIGRGDNVHNGRVAVTVVSPNGKSILREALETVSVDTELPTAITGVLVVDKPDDEGGYVILSWLPSDAEDFSHYNIYQSEQPIISLRGLEPIDERISSIGISTIEIPVPVPVPGVPDPTFYFAVTVVDMAANEALITRESSDGPVSGSDNLPPEPVVGIIASDRAYDNGKIITVTWSDPAVAQDFYRYHIYMDVAPINSVLGLAPVDASITDRNVLLADIVTPADGVGFYFAVTAVDFTGNESLITIDFTAGPVASEDNLGVAPDTIVKIISGPVGEIHYDDVTFRWNRWFEGQISGYYYKLDNGNWIWTSDTYKTYYDLNEGKHTFYVRADLGAGNTDPMPATRIFAVKRILLSETEPNDSGGRANWISKGVTIFGTNVDDGDDDWYRFHVESDGLMTLHFNRIGGVGSTNIAVFRSFPPTPETSIGFMDANPIGQRQSFSTGVGLGDYFILVDSQGEDPDAKYEISVTANEIPENFHWDSENNDLPALAQLLIPDTQGIEVSGFGNGPDDVDWYRLQVSDPGTGVPAFMKLDFVRPRGIGITEVSVFAAFPHDLESSKIGLIVLQPTNGQSQSLTIPARSGDYYLRVDNSQEADISSIYSFRVSFAPASGNWEIEPNGIFQFANLLPLNEVMKGTSWHPDDDEDWYRVRLDRRGTLVLSYFRPFGTGSAVVRLKAADASDIAEAFANVLTSQKATISVDLNLGDYLVVIDPEREEDASAEYQLVATIVDSIEMEIQYPEPELRDTGIEFSVLGVGASISITVVWNPGNVISFDVGELRADVPMSDDAGDGVYVGTYTVQEGDDISDAEIVLHLNMPPGSGGVRGEGVRSEGASFSDLIWTADLRLEDKVTIDTTPPKISRVDHNVRLRPLSAGETLDVTMTGEAGALDAFFDIVLLDENGDVLSTGILRYSEIPMVESSNGTYTGSYTVEEEDDLESAFVLCHLTDAAGNESLKSAARQISFDTTAPEIIRVEHDARETLVEGHVLTITLISDTMDGKANFSIDGLFADRVMYDDGSHGDSAADDGIYTGQYTVRKGDNVVEATITVRLIDEAGNATEEKAFEPVSMDTAAPDIASFVHDASDTILSEDDVLTVTLNGEPGSFATFDIEELVTGLPIYDDGTRADQTADDGVYIGTYTVQEGDSAKNARITGYLTDKNGNETVLRIFEKVNIDAVPPLSVVGVQARDKSDDQGFWLILSWEASTDDDFHSYNIYREAAPITSVLGLTPLADSSALEIPGSETSIEVTVPANGVDYYLAVTASDEAGNESLLDRENGVAGPVQAFDNITPEPVTIVSAADRPDDQGKSIVVSWTKISTAEDFDYYGIYLSDEPIVLLDEADLIMAVRASDTILVTDDSSPVTSYGAFVAVPSDNVDFYFAVTAFDENGNESLLDTDGGSVAGPVRATDDTKPKPVILVSVTDTPGDGGGSLDVWWEASTDEEIREYNFYLSDGPLDNDAIQDMRPSDAVSASEVVVQGSIILYELHPPVDLTSFYVAITAVDFGGNNSDLDKSGRSVSDAVQSVSNTVRQGASTTIFAGFDPDTRILIPAGAIGGGETVDIFLPDESTLQKVDEADRFLEGSHIDLQIDTYFADTVREFEASASNIFKPVEITLSYPDVVDMQSFTTVGSNAVFALSQNDESDFRVFRLNELSRIPRWELVSGAQEVDILQNTVSVFITKFGVFRVARLKLPDSLNRVVVYPNPFIPSQSLNGYVTFKNLTENATIQIYDMAGRRVRTLDKGATGGDEAIWDARNTDGDEVASGTYVFIIQSQEDTFMGKVIVLR